MSKTTSSLDIGHGFITDFGVVLTITENAPEHDLLGFDTMDEAMTYLSGRYDTYNITVTQGPMRRNFTVWHSPWEDAQGPWGETWKR